MIPRCSSWNYGNDSGFVPPGGFIEPGFPAPYRMSVHCGIEWLGTLNDVAWRTDVPAGELDWIPDAWRAVVREDQTVELEVLLETGPPARLTATANGHSIEYEPTTEAVPECDRVSPPKGVPAERSSRSASDRRIVRGGASP